MANKQERIKVISFFPLLDGGDTLEEIMIPVKRIKKYALYRSQNADCDVFSIGVWYGDEFTLFHEEEYAIELTLKQLENADW